MKGKLITIEGNDGTGKQTQSELLTEYLIKEGYNARCWHFPDYSTESGKSIRQYLNGEFGDPTLMDPLICSVPYAINRFEKKEELTRFLEGEDDSLISGLISRFRGKKEIIGVLDRYVESNFGYQCAKVESISDRINILENLKKLEHDVLGLPKSDIVLFLYLDENIASEAMKERVLDGHEKNINYQRRVRDTYEWLAEIEGWYTIDCMGQDRRLSIEEVHHKIVRLVDDLIIMCEH